MKLYYITARRSNETAFNFNGIERTRKSIQNIKDEISQNPNFCRDEKSITKDDLIGYLSDGIFFFTENDDGKLTGLIHFEVNKPTITIQGLCVPPPSAGIGSYLINKVKEFGQANGFTKIKLSCYDDKVSTFYKKQGFTGTRTTIYDSDEDSDDEGTPKYDMEFTLTRGGSTSKKTKRLKKTKKNKRMKQTKRTKKSKKTRKYYKK